MHASHQLNVSVVSPEEAECGTAEFWADGLFGFTRFEDGELVLRIEPRSDGGAVVVSAHGLAEPLARAKPAPRILMIRNRFLRPAQDRVCPPPGGSRRQAALTTS